MTGQTERSRGQPTPAVRPLINLRHFPDFPASRRPGVPRRPADGRARPPRYSYKLPTRFRHKSNDGRAKCIYYCSDTLRTESPTAVRMFRDRFADAALRRKLVTTLRRNRGYCERSARRRAIRGSARPIGRQRRKSPNAR